VFIRSVVQSSGFRRELLIKLLNLHRSLRQYSYEETAVIIVSNKKDSQNGMIKNILHNIKISLILITLLTSACQSSTDTAKPTDTPSIVSVDIEPTKNGSISTSTPGSTGDEIESEPTKEVFLPAISAGDQTVDIPDSEHQMPPQLAYLSDGNLWLVDIPSGTPIQLTESGDLFSFAWSPDGSQIATFNGKSLCQLNTDGKNAGCIDLKLDEYQSEILREIVWSPDSAEITLWNRINPWDELAIGWIIVPLNSVDDIIYIIDPVDWGAVLSADNEPGGVTGTAKYLADGTLIGTITHRLLCSESGCHYKLYYYNPENRTFQPYPNRPEEGFSEGMGLEITSDGTNIINFGTFHTGCEAFITFIDIFDTNSEERQVLDFPQTAINGLGISPDGKNLVISHNAGCSTQNENEWAQTCGLSQNFDVYPIISLELINQEHENLLPGLSPTWSPDNAWLAFRSCLKMSSSNEWTPSGDVPPGIYIFDWKKSSLELIAEGDKPQWRP